MINYLLDQRNVRTVAEIHDWFVEEGYIPENTEDESATQADQFWNPLPGSKYWENDWPIGKFIFVRIFAVTIVLHGNKKFCDTGGGVTGVFGVSHDSNKNQNNPYRVRLPEEGGYKRFPNLRSAANYAKRVYPRIHKTRKKT